MGRRRNILMGNIRESVLAVIPIAGIVFFLCLLFLPVDSGLMLAFLIGTAMIIVGMAFFNIGANAAMTQIGMHTGAKLTASRKLGLILGISFLLGVMITVAEPDLQVLAAYVPDIDTWVLIAAVSVGVGIFLMISMLRILFRVPMRWLLLALYGGIFLLAAVSRPEFLSVAFDSGGVTTGPMTVPFIMSLGIGVASIRSDERAKSDSFGLIALCSVGPILAVLLLGFLYQSEAAGTAELPVGVLSTSVDVGLAYVRALPQYLKEVSVALLPILLFFLLFQLTVLRLKKRPFLKILIGLCFTYGGLVLFLTGVNVGFSALGYVLGGALVEHQIKWLALPLAMLMGWFIIGAEPAVHVLTKQVSALSAGAISEKAMARTLSVAIALANGLAMIRVLSGASILWFVAIGYALALGLAFFVPPTYTAIAFDAGGVASGPMTAAFMLPFAMGITSAVGGNVMTDAFGLVALVAIMPLITVQVMGVVAGWKSRRVGTATVWDTINGFADDETIELWEVA